MTVQPTFFDWVRSGLDFTRPPYESCSPNLRALRDYLNARWPGGQDLGCEGDRTIRIGVTQSEHSWGAAWDWRYPEGAGSEISTFAIDNSLELGVCSIHDYLGDRIWRAGRTLNTNDAHGSWWKKQNGAGSGMGESWADYFHFVTTFAAFHNATPITDRLPKPPDEEDDVSKPISVIKPKPGWQPGYDNGNGPATFVRYGSGTVQRAIANDEEVAMNLGAAATTHDSIDWYNDLLRQSGSGLPTM